MTEEKLDDGPSDHELMVMCHDLGLRGVWEAGRAAFAFEAGRVAEAEDRHGMTHPQCDECWWARRPGVEPARVLPEVCCFCGERTRSGIYVRAKGAEAGFCPDHADK